MDALTSKFNSGSMADRKKAVMEAIQMEQNIQNARALVAKINENCFEKCVAKPGSSLNSGEQTCLSKCMEKYMSTWNVVSREYINRVNQERH